jgi:hypothetical protein
MRSRSTIIATLLAVVLGFTLVDPLQIASGKYDSNPYTEIAQQLDQSSTTGVLVLASYADLYKFPIYRYLRDILGTRLAYHGEMVVEYEYDEVLGQASLGEKVFLQYLKSKKISHLIIPGSTAEAGAVFHRWTNLGTINLDLSSQAFTQVLRSGGDFPLALYAVNFTDQIEDAAQYSYSLEWSGVRPEFHQLLRIINEDYYVKFLRKYEESIDVAWVFNGEKAKVLFNAESNPDQLFTINLQFVAAYGDKAPPQELQVLHGQDLKVLYLNAGEISSVSFEIKHGESLEIEALLGCRPGTSFAPEDQDIREFCYGLRDVIVRTTN